MLYLKVDFKDMLRVLHTNNNFRTTVNSVKLSEKLQAER